MLGLFSRGDASNEPPGALAVAPGPAARQIRRIMVAFEPPDPPAQALAMATELALRLGAELLLACAIEWHPRYGGAEGAEAVRRNVRVAGNRLRKGGIAATGEVAITLVGEGARVLAQDAVESEADLMIVAARRSSRFLSALGMGFAQRLIRASRVPVLLLPGSSARRMTNRMRRGWPAQLEVLGGL